MNKTFTVSLPANSLEVRAALGRFVSYLHEFGLPAEVIGDAELAAAEMLNNIVEHAYGDTASGKIDFTAQISDRILICRFQDTGRPMPNARIPDDPPHSEEALLALPEGGFGWQLIKDTAAEILYVRQDGQNTVFLKIRTDSASRDAGP